LQDSIEKLKSLLLSENVNLNEHFEEVNELIKALKKKATVNEFLAGKYKRDYEITVDFLKTSIEEIETKQEQLLEANIELERFAYVVSHDLKAPVRSIIGFIQLIEKELNGIENKDLNEYFDFVKSASIKMHELIQETLEFSKLNKANLKWQKVDINEIIKTIAETLASTENEYEVQIEYEKMPTIIANKAMMHKLFQNFIENGIKYNRNIVRIVHVAYQFNEPYHQFKFIDNGIGISDDNQEKIFDMYTRLNNESEFEGTGLGLAICKKIIESHEGKIELSSIVDNGSMFNIFLKSDILNV